MKHILPINNSFFLKGYTHHAYRNAIISSSDKVQTSENDSVVELEVRNFETFPWQDITRDITYKIDDDFLFFYSHPYSRKQNAFFWRTCNDSDEISLKIHKQLYSNYYSSITIVLVPDNIVFSNIDSMFSYNYPIKIGFFAGEGLYYSIDGDESIIYCSEFAELPIEITLKKTINSIQFFINDNKKVKSIYYDFSHNNTKYRIGFLIKLDQNIYYNWLFSNYINLYYTQNSAIKFDYLTYAQKNYDFYNLDYFLDFKKILFRNTGTLSSILEIIRKEIDNNTYIEIEINDNLHLHNEDNNKPDFHQNLIYGYDDSLNLLYLVFVDNGKYIFTKMEYRDFLSERNEKNYRNIILIKYLPRREGIPFDIKRIIQVYKEFLNSCNISYYDSRLITNTNFGINAIKSLLSEQGIHDLLHDIRIIYTLLEHSLLNERRLDFLYYTKYITSKSYQILKKNIYKDKCASIILKNSILKYQMVKYLSTTLKQILN